MLIHVPHTASKSFDPEIVVDLAPRRVCVQVELSDGLVIECLVDPQARTVVLSESAAWGWAYDIAQFEIPPRDRSER